jgi:hypothetical protein
MGGLTMEEKKIFGLGSFFAFVFLGVTLLWGVSAFAVLEPCEDPCGEEGQVLVCHVPPGNPNAARTICIEADSSVDHLENHELDECGECVNECAPPYTNECGDGCCDPRERNPRNQKWFCFDDCVILG